MQEKSEHLKETKVGGGFIPEGDRDGRLCLAEPPVRFSRSGLPVRPLQQDERASFDVQPASGRVRFTLVREFPLVGRENFFPGLAPFVSGQCESDLFVMGVEEEVKGVIDDAPAEVVDV